MLEIHDLTFHYTRKTKPVLQNINLTLPDGEIGILLGRNGSGKTTLIKNILDICHPEKGSISFNNQNLSNLSKIERANLISYVPQNIQFGSLSVFDSVLLGRISLFGYHAVKEDYNATERVLLDMGLSDHASKNVTQLSGGEQQKVAIARALVKEPKLMIFDEPTANLDITNEQLVLNEMRRLSHEKHISILCSLHDLNQALSLGDQFYFMKDGVILHDGSKECFTEANLNQVFDSNVRIIDHNNETIILGGKRLE